MSTEGPGTLVKAHPAGKGWDFKQLLIASITGLIDLKLIGNALDAYFRHDMHNFVINVSIGLLISIPVLLILNDDFAYYKAQNIVTFLYRWIRKKDFIYLYDEESTPDEKLEEFIVVRDMDKNSGVLSFDECKIYKNDVINTGYCCVLDTRTGVDSDLHTEALNLFLFSIKDNNLTKFQNMQTQDVDDIIEKYEALLKTKLTPEQRVGIFSVKQYLKQKRSRVNNLQFMFVGVGYFTEKEKEKAAKEVKRSYDNYKVFLKLTGIESRLITTQWEYEIIYKQFFTMQDLGVIRV
jgi:low affinity Fe/Cu permease